MNLKKKTGRKYKEAKSKVKVIIIESFIEFSCRTNVQPSLEIYCRKST